MITIDKKTLFHGKIRTVCLFTIGMYVSVLFANSCEKKKNNFIIEDKDFWPKKIINIKLQEITKQKQN